MKHIILFLFLFITNLTFSQENQTQYPIFSYDSATNTTLVIFTLQQAQKIDNDYELLQLLEKSKGNCDSLAQSYKILVKNIEKVIAQQDVNINVLKNLDIKNNQIIKNLEEQIAKYKADSLLCDSLVKVKDEKINIYKGENIKLKTKNIFGFAGFGVFGIISAGLLTLLLIK